MTLDVSKYARVKHTIKFFLENYPNKDLESTVTEIAVASETPIVAVCYHYAEVIGKMTPELKAIIVRISDFYKYTKIEGSIYANEER